MCPIPGNPLRFSREIEGIERKAGWRLSELLPDTASHILSMSCASLAAVMETSDAVALGVRRRTASIQLLLGGQAVLAFLSAR